MAEGDGKTELLNFLKNNIDTEVSALTARQVDACRDFMNLNNIDIAWIGANTKIREIIHYMVTQLPFRKITFQGHDF